MNKPTYPKHFDHIKSTGAYSPLPIDDSSGVIIPFGTQVVKFDHETLVFAEDFDYNMQVDYQMFTLTEKYWCENMTAYKDAHPN